MLGYGLSVQKEFIIHHPSYSREALTLGVCDYPEQVPSRLWAEDARQQQELGLRYVRLTEFTWSRIEPEPGTYQWTWLDTAIKTYAAAGLHLVLCTPTAAPPAWLVAQHPEILPVGRDGQVKTFGSRRHYDFSSRIFAEHSRRITRALAERYGQHPSVVGWQTDNEFGWGDTAQSFSPSARTAFQGWLEQRYGTLERLNEAWGNVFWSMEYSGWEQIPLPNLAVSEANPSHALDFLRFSSDQVAAFQDDQVRILRECSPGRFVTHNFMGFFSGYDHYRLSRPLDFASWDSYPTGTLEALHEWKLADADLALTYARTGHPDLTAFNHDLYRGMKGSGSGAPGFWVMEQQCGQVNWAPSNPLPADGAVELWTAQAWAHGADTVCYFRWRAAHMAQEVLHSGLLRHNSTPDRGYSEVERLDLTNMPLAPMSARVALLHDYESLWIYNLQPHAQRLNYWAQTFAYYRALRSLGQDVDIVHPDSDLSGYALIVAPALTLMTPERAARLMEASAHARLVFGPRTAFRTVSGRTPDDGQPGDLTGLFGASLLNFDSLPVGLEQRIGNGGPLHTARAWAESYALHGSHATHFYQGGPLDAQAAVVRYGQTTVIGAHSDGLIEEVLGALLAESGLPVQQLPEGVRLSRRGTTTLVQNWTESPVHWQGIDLAAVSSRVLHKTEVLV